MADDLFQLGANDALQRFRDRTLSPVELLDALVARADLVEPTVNAWSDRRLEQAYAAARAAQERWAAAGGSTLPLDGVPVAMKEEQPIIGEPWRNGSLLSEHDVAEVEHPLYGRLVEAGAVIHARTTTPEFSCAGFTHSRLWGLTVNPWNAAVSCGGSSGGSAVSLATGTAVLATGSDIGGSIRLPSSLCGVIGFKPPHGRVPTLPPYNLDTYSHDGPMGRSVADVALMQNVIAGAHPVDHISMRNPPHIPLEPESIVGMHIAYARTIGDIPVDADVEADTAAFIDVLRGAGAVVHEVQVPLERTHLRQTALVHFASIFGAQVASIAGDRAHLLSDYAADFVARAASAIGRTSFFDGLQAEVGIQQAVARAMRGADALVCPTIGSTGWAAGDGYTTTRLMVDGVELEHYIEAAHTLVFNIASKHPVLNVPSGVASNGVPTGVQIVGHTYDDATPFRIGAAAERELRWWSDPSWWPTRH
jgi:aspartyl-tRNA(Asn)/glutamyl-tRNA(Gln) amidotransferase subunit A